MAVRFLDKTNTHSIWVEEGIIIDESVLVEVNEDTKERTFRIIENHLRRMKGRKLVMFVLPNLASLLVNKGDVKSRLIKMGIEKLAIVTGGSHAADIVINFTLRMVSEKGMKMRLFKTREEAKSWLLGP